MSQLIPVPGSKSKSSRILKGTTVYMPPEVLFPQDKTPNKATDVYSFGVLLWEIFSGCLAYHDFNGNQAELKETIRHGHRPDINAIKSQLLKTLISNCWRQNPNNRPTIEQCLYALKDIFIEQIIPVPIGQVFWRDVMCREFSNVSSETLLLKFFSFVDVLKCTYTKEDFKYMMYLLSGKSTTATIVQFGKFLGTFGPITNEKNDFNIIQRIINIRRRGFYHPNMNSPSDAALILSNRESGHYLLRPSSSSNAFTLSRNENNTIINVRIEWDCNKGTCKTAKLGELPLEIYEYVERLSEVLTLTTPIEFDDQHFIYE